MNLLSGHDEIILLVILNLGDNAYGTTIRREVSLVTGKEWSIGAVYDPLYRMEKKGLIESILSRPLRERGGRSRRMFSVRKEGLESLVAHKTVRDSLWQELNHLSLNEE
ncbi:MAG: PadR family transcriptional regulator [Candidatus Aminicenantes bacterium]|nr:PadR family transcriptional regulator [Candidatus Aminicenantes bacterium]